MTLKLTKYILEETNIGVEIDRFGRDIPAYSDFRDRASVLSSLNLMLDNLHSKPTENKVREIVSNQIEHFKNVLKNQNTRVRNIKNDIAVLNGFIKDLESNKK